MGVNGCKNGKENYYLALRRTQGTIRTETPNWLAWLLFFLKALNRQMQLLRGKIEREKMLLMNLPDLSIQILDVLKDRGRISIGEAVAITGANRNTLKPHFKNLLDKGLIKLYGRGRGAWYGLL